MSNPAALSRWTAVSRLSSHTATSKSADLAVQSGTLWPRCARPLRHLRRRIRIVSGLGVSGGFRVGRRVVRALRRGVRQEPRGRDRRRPGAIRLHAGMRWEA